MDFLQRTRHENELLTQIPLTFYVELNTISGHYSVVLINSQWLSAGALA